MSQGSLFEGVTPCGYCNMPLAPVGDGSFACPSCAPDLAKLKTLEEWGDWMRAKRRARARA